MWTIERIPKGQSKMWTIERIPKGQSKMYNPEKLATGWGKAKQNRTQHMLETTMRKQTPIT
jgi:hypothetical protein